MRRSDLEENVRKAQEAQQRAIENYLRLKEQAEELEKYCARSNRHLAVIVSAAIITVAVTVALIIYYCLTL